MKHGSHAITETCGPHRFVLFASKPQAFIFVNVKASPRGVAVYFSLYWLPLIIRGSSAPDEDWTDIGPTAATPPPVLSA